MSRLPLVFLAGDAKVLKDEHVKGICEKKKVKRMKVSLEEKETAFNLLSQGGLFFTDVLLDITDFDDWKKDDQKKLLELAEKAKIDVIVRTEESVKAKDILVLALPKPWEHEKWTDYVSQRLKKTWNISFTKAGRTDLREGRTKRRTHRERDREISLCDEPTDRRARRTNSFFPLKG